jgi:hypothetical protein
LPFGTPDRIVERATVDPRRRHLEILFAMAWKPCSFCRGIGIHFAVEFVFFLPWNSCLLWRGIFNGSLRFQIVVRSPWLVHGKTPYWSARWPDGFSIDFLVYCRMVRGSPRLLDFFIIPAGYIEPGKFTTLVGPNARDFPLLRHPDLRVLLELIDTVKLAQVGRFLERA